MGDYIKRPYIDVEVAIMNILDTIMEPVIKKRLQESDRIELESWQAMKEYDPYAD